MAATTARLAPGEDDAASAPAALGQSRVRQLIAESRVLERTLRELRLGLDSHSIVALTDRRGVILEANEKFVEISKYSYEELIGAPQSIVNSGHHPKTFFREMWRTIGRGEIWQGEICNRAKDGSHYWVATTIVPLLDERGRPDRYLSIRTDITKLRRAERRVRKLAFRDQLTGLANRAATVKQLNELADRPGADFRAYLTLSFEDLALINDAFGYEMGDRVLRRVAAKLLELGDRPDAELGVAPVTVARVGSNAFGLSFASMGESREEADRRVQEMAPLLAEQLNAVIRADFGEALEMDLRIGYVIFEAAEGLDGAAIFTNAETARRRAVLSRGRPAPQGFDAGMIAETQDRVNKLFDLRRGVARGNLRLFLQPVVSADRARRGFEALVRWQDPERGLVAPDDFIPLAERTGLIIEIGSWVLDQACLALAAWSERESTAELIISVNVSEVQLRHPDFVDTVIDALRRHDVRPELLKLEVTESMIHEDLECTIALLERLRAERIEIALDDFGEGYSSLSALKRLPVQILKVDQALVASVADDPLCEGMIGTIVNLAHLMGLRVVAEGVETEAQFSVLQRLGVDRFQGFLFGRPAQIDPASSPL